MDSPDTSLAIRPARSDDAVALAPFLAELGFPARAEDIASRIESMAHAGELLLVAEMDGQPVGLLTAHLTPMIHRSEPLGRLTVLFVARHARRRGIARALLAAAESRLLVRGCTQLEVISNRRYTDGHAFYEAVGYEMTSFKFRKYLRSSD